MRVRRHIIVVLIMLVLAPWHARGQGKDLLPGENLVAEGIPPVPAALAESAQRYAEFRGASFASWHPERLEMLIMTRFADVPQVHWVKMPGGARTQMTFFPDRIAGASFNRRRAGYFLFSKDVGGGEWFQIYRYDIAGGAITLLTDGRSRNSPPVWSTAADRVAYGSTRRNGRDIDLYIMDPRNPEGQRMVVQLSRGEAWTVLDWSPDDGRLLAVEEVSANESYLWLFDTRASTPVVLAGEGTAGPSRAAPGAALLTPLHGDVQVAYAGGIFGRDGKGIYTTTDLDNEFRRLAYLDIASGRSTFLTSDIPWDVQDFDLTRDGRSLAFVTNENGVSKLYLYDVRSRSRRRVEHVPVGVISGLSWHNDGVHLAFTMGSARSSTDAYVLDARKGTVERWTFSETGGLVTAAFPEPELITWKTFDGRMISGFLYRPPARFEGKRPVIVDIHGGPEGQALPRFIGRSNYYLNELGVAVIFPNVRGSTGYGKTYLKMDNGFRREDSYRDIESLLDWIAGQPALDAQRIMVTGGSYGGHMTLAIASRYSNRIRCAVDVVGMSNLVTFLEHTEAYRRDLRRVEYGDERDPKMREFLERIAPLTNARQIARPLFIIQGKNDPRVPASEAEQMVRVLKENGVPVWYLMANDEGHGFAKKKNADYQFYATILFMKTFLLN